MREPTIKREHLETWAGFLLDHSLEGITSEDRVMIKGERICWPLMAVLERRIIEAGGVPDIYVVPPNNDRGRVWSAAMGRHEYPQQLGRVPEWHQARYEGMTKYIEVLGAEDPSQYTDLDAERVKRLAMADRPFANIRLAKPWVLTLYPTPGFAEMEGMPLSEYVEFIVRASTTNPLPLKDAEQIEPHFSRARTITIETACPHEGRDLKLTMNLEQSLVQLCYGKANFPDGEVFTSPDANSVEGEIFVDLPVHYGGHDIQGIYLKLEAGQITSYKADVGQAHLEAIIETDAGSHRLGEVALGMNPGLEKVLKHPLFVEKVGGTLHIAIGMSYEDCFVEDPSSDEGRAILDQLAESGVCNRSAQHVDIVTDFRPGGSGKRVLLDDQELALRDGLWSSPSEEQRVTLREALAGGGLSRGRRFLLCLLALTLAAGAWLPAVHLLFAPAPGQFRAAAGIAPRARQVAARHLALWSDAEARQRELARMRSSNAEWDFMGRTFLVLALSNLALRETSAAARYLEVTDRIIDQTLLLERQEGMYFFLMDYARAGPFVVKPARSLFVDGEIALMLAARCLVRDKPAYRAELRRRVALMVRQMAQSPVRCGESYPDECWTFCNSVAIAAIHLADLLEGARTHRAFIRSWLDRAKRRLVDSGTGILLSSYHLDGRPKDGPEGSSIWLAAHCLQLVDPALARDQYRRAQKELGRTVLGFGYAREWPEGWVGPADIDSGPIVPLLEASAGSSGLALLGAAAFDDDAFFDALCATLELAGFPAASAKGGIRYAASNQVGDAVMLYAMVQGPLWARARGLASAPSRAGVRSNKGGSE